MRKLKKAVLRMVEHYINAIIKEVKGKDSSALSVRSETISGEDPYRESLILEGTSSTQRALLMPDASEENFRKFVNAKSLYDCHLCNVRFYFFVHAYETSSFVCSMWMFAVTTHIASCHVFRS